MTAATQAQEALEAAIKRKLGDVALGAILAMSRAIRAYRKRKRRTLEINKYAAERWGASRALTKLCMHVLTTAPFRH